MKKKKEMAENVASGGKVWNLIEPKGAFKWSFTFYYGIPSTLLVAAPSMFSLWHSGSKQYEPSIAGGYGAAINSDVSSVLGITLACLLAVAIVGVIILSKVATSVSSTLISLGLIVSTVIFLPIITVFHGPNSHRFDDWAEQTYGYHLTGPMAKKDGVVTYEAINKYGQKVTVKSFVSDDNTYLYETLPELETIIHSIVKAKEGQS